MALQSTLTQRETMYVIEGSIIFPILRRALIKTCENPININENEMVPIYCVNQTEEEYFNDKELKGIEEQLNAIPEFTKYIIIAYEPTWMIGGDTLNIDKEHIEKVLIRIKSYLMEQNINHSIIYGGGVTKDNVSMLKTMKCNDGFIISTSALEEETLEYIYNEIN